MRKIKMLSLFTGIGSPEQALKNLNFDVELAGFSEIDKFAIKSYCAVHDVDESLNLGDITKINIDTLPKDIDLITHGSPCQDFSVAGKGRGADIGTGTRSSLMWNTVAICNHCKPKFVVWENVKNVLSKKHIHNFEKYLESMENIGYKNYYKVLNAKDFGIPQNRERIFIICIRNDLNTVVKMPTGMDQGIRLKHILEESVEDKYYLSNEIQKRFKANGKVDIDHNELNQIGTTSENRSVGQRDRTYGENGICPNLIATDYKQPKQIVDTKSEFKIRKLTPKECFRLMGFDDEDYLKVKEIGITNSAAYKLAGNSIVVNCLYYIFEELFREFEV